MEIKIKRKDVEPLLIALVAIINSKGALYPIFFQYFLTRNRSKIISLFNVQRKEYERLTLDYDKDRALMLEKYCIMNNGKPVLNAKNEYTFTEENGKIVNREGDLIYAKHKDAFDTFNKFLLEDVIFEAHKVNIDRIENISIPSGAADAIAVLIDGADGVK